MAVGENPDGAYKLDVNPSFASFQNVEVTKVDETKPWKPPVEVSVTKADGSTEIIDASTPFFTFEGADGG
ncbi:hypothetical protein HN709_04925, partial [Candidatus Peregrinibacteria bacterium]|nr:hypothetical protein [Candidatus Peregrinibacteria bacterium]